MNIGGGVGTHREAVRRQPFDLRVAEAVIGETWFVRFLSGLFTRFLLALLGRMQPRCQQQSCVLRQVAHHAVAHADVQRLLRHVPLVPVGLCRAQRLLRLRDKNAKGAAALTTLPIITADADTSWNCARWTLLCCAPA